jgi:hypothetical protein
MFQVLDFFNPHLPAITLLMVSLIASSLLLSQFNTRHFIRSVLPTGSIKTFDSKEETLNYVLRRMRKAKTRVWDVTWGRPMETGFSIDDRDRKQYYDTIVNVSKSGKLYREIMMFCGREPRIQKARYLLNEAGKGYELKVFPDITAEITPRRWQFVIVDDEVILDRLALKQPGVIDWFCRYYESQWEAAIPIKVGNVGGEEELAEYSLYLR